MARKHYLRVTEADFERVTKTDADSYVPRSCKFSGGLTRKNLKPLPVKILRYFL
jgi:hypothetical protein